MASILNQDYQDWRLLIIDDGSTDSAILDVEKLKDTRIEIIHVRQTWVYRTDSIKA